MSRIGKNPITIPDGVKIELKGNLINVSGQKGSQSWSVHTNIKTLIKLFIPSCIFFFNFFVFFFWVIRFFCSCLIW